MMQINQHSQSFANATSGKNLAFGTKLLQLSIRFFRKLTFLKMILKLIDFSLQLDVHIEKNNDKTNAQH